MTVESDVNGLLADSRINFRHIDRLIVRKFDTDILSKVNNFFIWLEEQRNEGKEIIRNETGRIRLPKTPKRGYCFSQEAETFQRCRKKLLDSAMPKKIGAFANDGNTMVYAAQTPKSSRNAAARAIKEEPVSASIMNEQRIPMRPIPPPRQHLQKQQTPNKTRKYPPTTVSGNDTSIRTPFRNVTPKVTTQKMTPLSTARKIGDTPKATTDRIIATPKIVKRIVVTPKANVQQTTFKRSEVIRKMEKRTNTVIKNKEELMKEKAERARREGALMHTALVLLMLIEFRDREERALRVKMNNKKKEEEALEKLRIIKMREQQIEALKQKQRLPQRAVSKSPCRTRGYYNRIQKPLVCAKSAQDISIPSDVLQKEKTKDDEEKLQFHGKRVCGNSTKQDNDNQSKRQKLDLMECSETSDNNSYSHMASSPKKVLSEEISSIQSCNKSAEIDDKRNSGKEDEPHVPVGLEKVSAVSEQEMVRSSQDCDVNHDVVMHSPVIENSKINEKENVAEGSQIIEAEVVTAQTSSMNNQTFDKSMDMSSNETLDDVGNNYDVDSISSGDETDDEENPRKPIPLWAQGEQLKNTLRTQVIQPPIDPDAFFGPVRTPMLDKIFARNHTRYNKRTSSAVWTSPMSNPKKGTSKFFELQTINHSDYLVVNGLRSIIMTISSSTSKTQVKDSDSSLLYLKQFRKDCFKYCCAAVFTIKFLLVPCYYSTDFEVHRNWMAITYTLPICSWYYEATSQWTLDYPPFFAFFEYILSQVASKIVPSALMLQKDAYFSAELLYFQRFSVIATDIFYGALTYCILLNMKHIYLCYAPAYILFYAANYLFCSRKTITVHGAKLAATLTLPFALSFGPFVYFCDSGILKQIWKRLFPFERGLTHAYWAPNFWALYNFADWYFYQVLKLTKRLPGNVHSPAYISGLVQEFKHSILPSISPLGTLLVTAVLLSPVVLLIRTRHSKNFPLLLTLSAFAFFLAGYHVHEKAVILITIPYTVLASLVRFN
uniref:dolichyl-P-Glc:Glc1Man9GlcNAc2-PP-dolichol alpha-1,3-glucosyltransferase n=1 Tax=Setaria digitata TaxID=48799 RepID=A0A915PQ48_9BILA